MECIYTSPNIPMHKKKVSTTIPYGRDIFMSNWFVDQYAPNLHSM